MKRLHEDEQGATAVMVAFVLFVLMAAGAIAVDLGNAWRVRQIATTATDAASLAEARRQAFVDLPTGQCDPAWTELLASNAPAADLDASTCSVQPTGSGTGYVVIETTVQAETFFARLFGIDSQEVYASSGAMFGYTNAAEGVRPIALCANNAHIRNWLDPELSDDEPTEHETAVDGAIWHIVPITSTAGSGCSDGEGAGNWGWLDFTPPAGGLSELKEVLEKGFHEFPITVDDCNAPDPTEDRCAPSDGDPFARGNPNDTDQGVSYLCNNEVPFWAVVYSLAEGTGQNTRYTIETFVPLIIRGYKSPSAMYRWDSAAGPTPPPPSRYRDSHGHPSAVGSC